MPERRVVIEDRGKREDAAALLPIFGFIFLMPFLANLFLNQSQIFGLPLDMLYLFAVWALLILGAFVLSRGLPHINAPDSGTDHKGNGAAHIRTD